MPNCDRRSHERSATLRVRTSPGHRAAMHEEAARRGTTVQALVLEAVAALIDPANTEGPTRERRTFTSVSS